MLQASWRLLGAACLVLASCRAEPETEAAEELRKHRATLEQFTRKLSRIERAVAALPKERDATCREPPRPGRVLVADGRELSSFTKLAPDAKQSFAFLLSPELRALRGPPPNDAAQALDAVYALKRLEEDHRYLAVVQSDVREAPRLGEAGFHPGKVAGRVALVSLADERPLCWTRFDAQSSEQVAGTATQQPNAVVWADLRRRVRVQLDEALGTLGKGLSAGLE